MLPPKLKDLWDGMEKNREATLARVSGLSDEEFSDRAGGDWSIAEILEHLVLAETGTSKVIRKMLKENAGMLPPYPADDTALCIRETGRAGERMREAPDAARPTGSYGKAEVLALAERAREATRGSFEMLASADPRSAVFPHPFFGDMNLYEWPYRIILEHERQHRRQIEGILRRLGK